MRKIINKVVAIMVVTMITGMNFLPVSVYAASELNQNSNTKEDNVKFNATVNGTYEAELNIEEQANLELSVSVKEAGYLKDITVSLEGNNYSLGEITDEDVKTVEENKIELNEVNTGEELNVQLPIKFNKKEATTEEEFNKESEVKLDATYVNEKGKEKKIEKSLTEKIVWKANGTELISQELIRYIKYENKTMMSFDVKDGIQDNIIPVKNKEISIIVPQIENTNPSKVIVSGENVDYNYENGILTIKKDNKIEDKYSWDSQDEYAVTYIYEAQTEAQTIETEATAKVTTINNEEIEGKTENNQYEIANEIGSLVELKVSGTSELSKGYMHTNNKKAENKLDTTYEANYQINVGYAEVLDKVEVMEADSNFETEEGTAIKSANDSVKVNKVSINGEELEKLLGKEGKLTVKNEAGEALATLTTEVTEAELNVNKISFEITKPTQEGILNVNVKKAIKGDSVNSKEEIDSFKRLTTTLQSKGYAGDAEISSSAVSQVMSLTEATSKASIDVSTDRLSTIVKNENVVFNIVLNKNKISDALYTNPTVRIKLPEQITNIEVLSGSLLYEDEIQPGASEVNGNEIIIRLNGQQTQYNTSTTTNGALIRLETNLTLNNLAPSSDEKVQVEYSNEYTGEVNTIEKDIKIIAPTGFVTTNTIKIDEHEATAVENDAELIKLKTKQSAKTMEVSANLVNNVGNDAEGFVVLGRIPFAGNKTVGGVELNSNINTTLASPIELINLDDATVYYSTNGEETVDGQGWTTQATSDVKSFMITKQGAFENKKGAAFKYTVTVPENLEYEGQVRENYGVYYNNDAQEGVARNLVEAKTVGIATGTAPDIKTEISAVDTNVGYAIDNEGTVTEGEFVTYRVKLTNTGSNDANNVKVTANLPEGLVLVQHEQIEGETGEGYYFNYADKNVEQVINTLKGGESSTLYFDTCVDQKLEDVTEGDANSEEAQKLQMQLTVNSDILEEDITEQYTVKTIKGTINAKLDTDVLNVIEPNQKYSYVLRAYNANFDEKNNVIAKVKLPKGIKYERVYPEYEAKYDEKANELTLNMGKIEVLDTKQAIIEVTNNSNSSENLDAKALVRCDGMNEDVETNTVTLSNKVLNQSIKVTHTSSILNEITDTDKIEFYIDMKNVSDKEETLIVEDIIPDELRVVNYYIDVDGQQIENNTTSYVNKELTIPAGKSAKVTIIAEPFDVDEGKTVEINNQPTITKQNGESIEVNNITIKIKGTQKVESDEVVEEGTTENSEIQEEEKTYRIAGTVWFDEDKNGQRETEEPKLAGIKLKLYDSNTKQEVKDQKGNNIEATTDVNGMYAFNDIKEGNYVIISQYNSNDYEVAKYKANGVQESANSDFVVTKLEGRNVATTDVIKLSDENSYGIDLGLTTKDKFDLEISNNISKITVINSETGNKEYNYDVNTAKIELSDEDVQNSTLLIEYNINVKNNGNIEGYAKSIVNYVPQGLSFNSELNKDWYLAKDGNLYTVSLANTKIKPGESENIKLVLVKKVSEDNIGIIRGKAEINSSYNEKGLEEINALSSKKANLSAADVIVARKPRVSALSAIGISVGIMALFAIVVYKVKEYIDKQYSIDE